MLRALGWICLVAAGGRPPAGELPASALDETVSAPVILATTGGGWAAAWEAAGPAGAPLRFSFRTPGAAGRWSERPIRLDDAAGARVLEPRLAEAGPGRILAVWLDARDGPYDVRLRRSPDGGATWPAPSIRVPGKPAGHSHCSLPAIAADGAGRVWVAWEDQRDGERDLWLARSTDGGESFLPESRLDTDAPGAASSFHPAIAHWDDGTVVVVWWDERDGLADVYLRRSSDAGEAWDPERRLDPGDPGAIASHDARLAVRGDTLRVSWTEGFGTERRQRVSADRGASFGPVRAAGDEAPSSVPGPDGSPWELAVRSGGAVLEFAPVSRRPRTPRRPARGRAGAAGAPAPSGTAGSPRRRPPAAPPPSGR